MKVTPGARVAAPARHSTFKTWGIVALAAGGAAVLGGVVTGSYALALDADLSSSCPSGSCDSSQNSKIDKLDRLALATNVLLGVGVATLIGGVVLLLISADAPADRSPLSLKPALGADSAGLLLEGRF